MVIFLEVTTGPDEGLKFKADEGIVIGRTKGQVLLNDPKVSSVHAAIERDSKNQLVLVDQGSSNGLVINGRKVKKIALLPGVSFEMGRSQIKVFQMDEEEAAGYGSIITWRSQLREELPKSGGRNLQLKAAPSAFPVALTLHFLQGIQTDDVLTLGYGPRKAGFHEMDIRLLDDEAPEFAFELLPTSGLAKIKSLAPTRVYLNKELFKEAFLNEGDLISFGNTIIRVGYV